MVFKALVLILKILIICFVSVSIGAVAYQLTLAASGTLMRIVTAVIGFSVLALVVRTMLQLMFSNLNSRISNGAGNTKPERDQP